MQPDKKRRVTSQQGVSRARILLKKNLGWLPGFPAGNEGDLVLWWCRPLVSKCATTVPIDRDRLRRMEMVLTKLRHRFPNALPRIVEDTDEWLGRMDHLLAELKIATHNRLPLSIMSWLNSAVVPRRWGERFSELWRSHEPLQNFLIAAFFLEVTGFELPAIEALDWIDEQAPGLLAMSKTLTGRADKMSLELPVLLFLLRREMHPKLQSVLTACFAEPTVWLLSSSDIYHYARSISEVIELNREHLGSALPEKQSQKSIGDALHRLVVNLVQTRSSERRRGIELLGEVLPSDLPQQLHAIWTRVDFEESRLLRLLRERKFAEYHREKTNRKPKGPDKPTVTRNTQDESFLQQIAYALDEAPRLGMHEKIVQAWIRFLSTLPDCNFLRMSLFASWEKIRVSPFHRHLTTEFVRLLTQLSQLINRNGDAWIAALQQRDVYDLIEELIDESISAVDCTNTLHLIEELFCRRGLTPPSNVTASLSHFAQGAPDQSRAVGLAVALTESPDPDARYFFDDPIRAAFRITDDVHTTASVLRILNPNHSLAYTVKTLGTQLRDQRLRRIAVAAILKQDRKLIDRLAAGSALVLHFRSELPELTDADTTTDWLDRYPPELHQPLIDLARITPNAAEIAERLLSHDFPSDSDLRRQIDGISNLLTQPLDDTTREHLGKRLINLQKRLDAAPPLSPRRLANLSRKIADRAELEIVARYLTECCALVADNLEQEFGTKIGPEIRDILEPPYAELLSGILELQGPLKTLGLRLLLHRFAKNSSDFSSEPPNRMFQQMLTSRGINLAPWLEDTLIASARTAKGEPYRLSFTRDVLDYLMMGFHFGTCLSPGDTNFFSTIANAVDLNKQVLYGKTPSGRVIGRCLFTLTDDGSILTYERYAHDVQDKFSEAVDEYARRLAREMNTVIASSGKVPNLVAGRWYDDGSLPADKRFDVRSDDGIVRTLLRTTAPDLVIGELRKLAGSDRELKLALGNLLWLAELYSRPELVAVFADTYGFDSDIRFPPRLRLAVLAQQAGLTESAGNILESLRPSTLPERLRRLTCEWCDLFHEIGTYSEVTDLFLRHSPTLALRAMRLSRSPETRRDLDETRPSRRQALARIHRHLGREKLAMELESQPKR